MNTPDIKAIRRWSDDSVQATCIKNNLYTRGTYDQYDKMLKSADVLQPTVENLYRLAKDIKDSQRGPDDHQRHVHPWSAMPSPPPSRSTAATRFEEGDP